VPLKYTIVLIAIVTVEITTGLIANGTPFLERYIKKLPPELPDTNCGTMLTLI